MYYVEFFACPQEHAWVKQSCLFSYKGIEAFKTYAQAQVDRASSKTTKERLAERFQLKVATNRRQQWEEAIKLADQYINNLTIERRTSVKQATSNTLKSSYKNTTKASAEDLTKTNTKPQIKSPKKQNEIKLSCNTLLKNNTQKSIINNSDKGIVNSAKQRSSSNGQEQSMAGHKRKVSVHN